MRKFDLTLLCLERQDGNEDDDNDHNDYKEDDDDDCGEYEMFKSS